MLRRRSFSRALALFAAAVLVTSAASAQQPIKIGAVLQLTGDLAWYGQEIGRGYELGAKYVNAHGGINGRPIELVKADVPNPTVLWPRSAG